MGIDLKTGDLAHFRDFVALSSSPRLFNFGLEQLKIRTKLINIQLKEILIQKFHILSKFRSNQAQILFSSNILYTSFDTEPRFLDHHLNFPARANAHSGFKTQILHLQKSEYSQFLCIWEFTKS